MKLPIAQTIEVMVRSKELNDLKILHLSDLHINKNTSIIQLNELINICHNLEFDFTVITGDIIDCQIKYIKEKIQILNKLKKDGENQKEVYYISGNHDLFYGLNDLKYELTNFIFMDNKYQYILYKNNKILIAGLPDKFSKFFKIKREEDKIKNYLSNGPSIFISHQPKDYKIALCSKTNLFLCGHTHGGQIFPFHYLVKLVQPFLAGLFYKQNTAIYVNKGLGTWGLDFRYKADAEITILKLIAKSVE
jgi:uncharacterized protein